MDNRKPSGRRGLQSRTPEERKEIASMGGKKSQANKKARKTLKAELLLLLAEGDTQSRISLALIDEAINGRNKAKAFETIRDTIGEKPKEVIEADVNNKVIKVDITDD